jgi:CubicO group peptidase (beta-lactamase class C family)
MEVVMKKWMGLCLAAVGLALVPAASAQKAADTVEGPLARQIDRYLNKAEANSWAGSALVAYQGKVLLAKGYGLADREAGTQETAATVFSIGSITKQFTAAAILKLEMQGKLSVDDPITKFFPSVPEDKKGITLSQLLTHTAGLVDALGDDYDPIQRDAFVKLALGSKLLSRPGERYRYSNVGFSLLGIIVELVSGRGYEQYLYDNILKPAGMERTGYVRPRFARKDLAVGYVGVTRWGTALDRTWLTDGPGWHLRANGGLLSTVGDMHRWYLAIRAQKILSPEATREYLTAHVREYPDGNSYYGYGWVIEKTERDTPLVWHNGGNTVYNAYMGFEPKEDLDIIVSSNVSGKISDTYAERIEKIVFGRAPEMDEKQLAEWTGTYVLPSGEGVEVRFDENDSLVASFGTRELVGWLSASGRERTEDTEAYNRQTQQVVAGSLAGDYEALAKAWDEPLAQVAKRAPAFWAALEKNGGPVQKVEVLGTFVPRTGRWLTYARLDFAKGALFLTFVWGEGRLLQLRDSIILERVFEARSATEFFSAPIAKTAGFEKDDQGRWNLVVKGSAGEMRAVKSVEGGQ